MAEEDDEELQEIWSWGAGTDGQLATGMLQDEHTPQLIHSLSSIGPIASLSCGGAHVIAVAPGGRVLTWGRGSSGQLGHGEMVNSSQPKIVEGLKGVVIAHVSAGWNHSGFVSENGALFTCGDGSFGQLGHGDNSSLSYPHEVSYFASKPVERVACGMRHSLVLLRGNVENRVYAFGSGKRGQLGISTAKVKSINLPQVTMGLANLNIIHITANGDHSSALSGDGGLYMWGRGLGCASDAYIPRHFDAAFPINKVALGWNHALLLTRAGEVLMVGGERHGVLGDPQKTSLTSNGSGNAEAPKAAQIITALTEMKVGQIAAGAEHSAIVTDDGSVMAWGWGEHGQLGLGDTNDQVAPQVVDLGHKLTEKCATLSVYCGSGFSFVVRTYDVCSQKKEFENLGTS